MREIAQALVRVAKDLTAVLRDVEYDISKRGSGSMLLIQFIPEGGEAMNARVWVNELNRGIKIVEDVTEGASKVLKVQGYKVKKWPHAQVSFDNTTTKVYSVVTTDRPIDEEVERELDEL